MTHEWISGSLDVLLSLVCLALARDSARRGNDFLVAGFLWISAASFVGGLRLGGRTEFADLHGYLTSISKGPGMLLLALGVPAALMGGWPAGRWLAPALSVIGVAAVTFLSGSSSFETLLLTLSLTLLVGLLALVAVGIRAGRTSVSLGAAGSIAALLAVGFAVQHLPLEADSILRPVDVTHLLLITGYVLFWLSVTGATKARAEE